MKQTSIILKRQVPIRFDEAPRSWLGGLPMMPKLTKWPRDGEGAPLHFIAQICCADLPRTLWNGLGPRKGWLLLFVETLKLEDHAENKTVQVLHTSNLGSEHQPPSDAPTVRHSMSDYIDYASPNIRRDVPKFWRRWPIDMVVQESEVSELGSGESNFPEIQGKDLYEGTVTQRGIHELSDALDRPLTWRGARYVVEGILRDLKPDEFERSFVGNSGLLSAPEFDHEGLTKEITKRARKCPDYQGGLVQKFGRYSALYASIEPELRAERRTGWAKRAYAYFDSEIAQFAAMKRKLNWAHAFAAIKRKLGLTRAEDQKEPVAKKGGVILPMKGVMWNIERFKGYRKALEQTLADYPGPDPEAALTEEMEHLGRAYLNWGARMGDAAKAAMQKIDAQNSQAPISASDWGELTREFSETSAEYWVKSDNILGKKSRNINMGNHVKMAIREDLLDLYTQDNSAPVTLSRDMLKTIEKSAKYIEPGLPHRMGGLPDPIQGGAYEKSDQLLFQMASDLALGWMWGDVGALYVTISQGDLRKGRFGCVEAWIEGH